jgi:ankyrin repeat protein
MLIVFF